MAELYDNYSGAVSLDGVRFERWQQRGSWWRLAATHPRFEQVLPPDGVLDAGREAALAEQGIFVAREADRATGFGVLCCGQGSVWPGMGRELYDNFPEARAAMDRIAACSNWDVLALMDEKDVETIGLTRWQQPYLFLLEYAQWSLFLARGLKADVVCGHSLGELIALCLGGVYSPEVGWYIMETRSRHMADLEEKSRRETGMMAVYADMEHVREVQALWPDLYISNYNGPEQFILSGPRDVLVETRKYLRKKRKAAVILNITLAFHHPSMRVLRDLDYRRLMSLEMQAATIPVYSCVTARPYPQTQDAICSSIMDLDENSVRWVDCVQTLWQKGLRHFLELGPGETLCTLVDRIEPAAVCRPATLRGHETETVRRALAWLYAAGHLDVGRIVQCAADLRKEAPAPQQPVPTLADARQAEAQPAESPAPAASKESGPAEAASAESAESSEGVASASVVRELLARACGREVASLHAGLDLRFDLNLRSSFFPALIEEAQQRTGKEVAFEDLLKVSTVGDLERLFSGGEIVRDEAAGKEPMGRPVQRPFLALCRHVADETGSRFEEVPIAPCERRFQPSDGLHFTLMGTDDQLLAALVETVASWKCNFLVPGDLPRTEDTVRKMGSKCWGRGLTAAAALKQDFDVLVWQGDVAAFEESLSKFPSGTRARVVLVDGEEGHAPAADRLARLDQLVERAGLLDLDLLVLLLDADWHKTGPLPGSRFANAVLSLYKGIFFWKTVDEKKGEDGACAAQGQQSHPLLLDQLYLDNPDISPFIFPERQPERPMHPPFSSWYAHFSPEMFPATRQLPADAKGFVPIPLGLSLEAQRQVAILASPGLSASGMTDVRIYSPADSRLGMHEGFVREARLVADKRPWMRHDGIMSRMCRVSTFLRSVNDAGRRGPHWEEILEGNVILSGFVPDIPPLWERDSTPGTTVDVRSWYERQNMGPGMRLLENLVLHEEQCGVSGTLAESAFLALQGIWAYTDLLFPPQRQVLFGRQDVLYLHAVEAIVQAVSIMQSVSPAATPCASLPSLVGFIRFGRCEGNSPLQLDVRRCWDQDAVVRYEAQVLDAGGHCLLTMNHLEYLGL